MDESWMSNFFEDEMVFEMEVEKCWARDIYHDDQEEVCGFLEMKARMDAMV